MYSIWCDRWRNISSTGWSVIHCWLWQRSLFRNIWSLNSAIDQWESSILKSFTKISVTLLAGYIVWPVGGDKWLSLWVSHWFSCLVNLFKHNWFNQDVTSNLFYEWVIELFTRLIQKTDSFWNEASLLCVVWRRNFGFVWNNFHCRAKNRESKLEYCV